MTTEQREQIMKLLEGRDVSEVLNLLMHTGNRYSRRTLRFFRWFCKWAPVTIMLFHMYGMWDFGHNPREMFVVHEENAACYAFIYYAVYIAHCYRVCFPIFLFVLEVSNTFLLLFWC